MKIFRRKKTIFILVFNLVDRLRVKGSSEITSKSEPTESIDLDGKATCTDIIHIT